MLGQVDFVLLTLEILSAYLNTSNFLVSVTCIFRLLAKKYMVLNICIKLLICTKEKNRDFHHMEFNLGDSRDCSTSFAPSSDREEKNTFTRSIWLQINQILFRDYL